MVNYGYDSRVCRERCVLDLEIYSLQGIARGRGKGVSDSHKEEKAIVVNRDVSV